MTTEQFSLATEDGLAELHGELMLPSNSEQPKGTLLMVPGGWFAERDGFLGDSYTEADLMFLRIARRLVQQNYIVARYDNRGVTGNEFTIGLSNESEDPFADTLRYFEQCVDSEVRKSVTPETLMSDAAVVYDFLTQCPDVNRSNIVVLAHSEGGIHVSRLIGTKRIHPQGILFASAITESPEGVVKWQMVDRYVDEVMRWDSDGDGRVSNDDVNAAYGSSYLIEVGIRQQKLESEGGHWTEPELRAYFTAKYEAEKSKTLDCADDEPFPRPGEGDLDYVGASHRWLKRMFTDDTPMVELLRDYQGQVAYHFGEIDRQFSALQAIETVNNFASKMQCEPKVTLHPNRGHAFGTAKPVTGPMDQAAEDLLVEEIVRMLGE
ncbi:MAG: alpha/beta hydrolase [Pirellulales bacterium]